MIALLWKQANSVPQRAFGAFVLENVALESVVLEIKVLEIIALEIMALEIDVLEIVAFEKATFKYKKGRSHGADLSHNCWKPPLSL
ncbi:hypothetical protein HHSLTHF2_05940 [Vreelandella venusta]|uniref:Uncharacterized protein n=1 Tax=Halomonas hydrothermalis TaxID=115561 RepID=A0A6F8U0H8_9GAMM|nr:hypothetical protein HHSLTHF2_05940 [Halomonas hydrothermalis]